MYVTVSGGCLFSVLVLVFAVFGRAVSSSPPKANLRLFADAFRHVEMHVSKKGEF